MRLLCGVDVVWVMRWCRLLCVLRGISVEASASDLASLGRFLDDDDADGKKLVSAVLSAQAQASRLPKRRRLDIYYYVSVVSVVCVCVNPMVFPGRVAWSLVKCFSLSIRYFVFCFSIASAIAAVQEQESSQEQ